MYLRDVCLFIHKAINLPAVANNLKPGCTLKFDCKTLYKHFVTALDDMVTTLLTEAQKKIENNAILVLLNK